MTALANWTMLSFGWRRLLALLVAGAVAGLSVAPLFILPALFVALPVLVWALDGAERRPSWGRLFGPAFQIGLAFGLGYFLVAIHWIGAAFFIEGGAMLGLMPLAVLALALGLAVFWGLASSLAHALWSEGPWRILALAASLALFEYLRGHVLTGFPFDLVGYGLTANDEMAQAASLVGIYGLTLVAILIGATPALIWPADERGLVRRLVPFFAAMAVIALQVGYGHQRLATTALETRDDIRLRLVQPAIPQDLKWELANREQTVERLIGLSESRTTPADPGLPGVTHVIWPESALPFFLSDFPDALARIARMLPDGVTLLTGAPREDYLPDGRADHSRPGYNSILAIDDAGEVVASYDKTHLVPVGEYLPFQDFFAQLGIGQFVPGANGWAPGEERRLMSTATTPAFLPLICYEAIFPGELGKLVQGAQFILNVTNDAWFDGSIGPAQHFHHARLRAVEQGVALVRVANSGVTALVDPLGRVTARLREGEMALLDVVPPRPLGQTLYGRLGDWPFLAAVALALLGLGLARRRARR